MTTRKKTRTATKKNTTNRTYKKLANQKNAFTVRTKLTSSAGVKVTTKGRKKGTIVEVILPSTTVHGKFRTVRFYMTGRQAKTLFRTLNNSKLF
jgi:hypothetical protein